MTTPDLKARLSEIEARMVEREKGDNQFNGVLIDADIPWLIAEMRQLKDRLDWSLRKEAQLKEQLFSQFAFDKGRITGLELLCERYKTALERILSDPHCDWVTNGGIEMARKALEIK